MVVYLFIAALFFTGEGELGPFEGWPGDSRRQSTDAVRAVGTYQTRLLKEGAGEASFYVLGDPPQLHFTAEGPAVVVLRVRGSSDGEVDLQIDLDAGERKKKMLWVVSEYSRELYLRVPAGMHLFSVVANWPQGPALFDTFYPIV